MSVGYRALALPLVAGVLATAAPDAGAQSLKDRLKQKAKERVDQKTDQAADKSLDKAEKTVKCAAGDTACAEKAKAEGKTVVQTDEAPDATASAAGSAAPKAFVNFDFVPGDRVLFADDFSRDNVGDFPRRLEFLKGNMEVAEFMGARWLRGTTDGIFAIDLPEALPQRFTLEFDHYGLSSSYPNVTVYFGEGELDEHGNDQQKFDRVAVYTWHGSSETSGGGLLNPQGSVRAVGSVSGGAVQNVAFPVRIMADGKYVKVYMAGTRVANVPNANLGRSRRILVQFDGSDDAPAYFTNFRVAAGGRALYDALAAEGRVATQGIYFDTGSDRIRPESAPTLKEIGSMLKEHGDLSLTIEGHTDNVGNAAANQTLSEKRAAAVRAALIAEYGIEAARLAAKGLGASKPAAPNETPEGRQMNRRVELVKR
jgi:OmpA-OmpF porin, OOP family